jgi:hypothetical protein
MHPQCQNNHNNPQMEIVIQQMVEVHAELMRVLTQNLINSDSKELPPGMQQVLDDHSQMIQMMPQILSSTNKNLPQNNLGSKEPRNEAKVNLMEWILFLFMKWQNPRICNLRIIAMSFAANP